MFESARAYAKHAKFEDISNTSLMLGCLSVCVLSTIVCAAVSVSSQNDMKMLTTTADELAVQVRNLNSSASMAAEEQNVMLKIFYLRHDIDPSFAAKLAHIVVNYSKIYQRDPDLILAVMKVESGFNPKVVSSTGAVGLMQLMPHWTPIFGIQGDLTDPDTATKYGLQVLNFYTGMYRGDIKRALIAYNAGPTYVNSHPNNLDATYANSVFKVYHSLKTIGAGNAVLN